MLSSSKSKFIKSLQLKKFRQEQNCFFVEGKINVMECLLSNFQLISLFLTHSALELIEKIIPKNVEINLVSESDLEKVGTYQSNNFGIAVLAMPQKSSVFYDENEWSLAFDTINDPGNLGTIIRTADWFGIKNIYCSADSVDVFNPKVLNSTKGSFARVNVHYLGLETFLKDKIVVSAEMNGEPLSSYNWKKGGILLMGNESHGVKKELSDLCVAKLTIPKIGKAESLNVAVATSLFCYEMKR
jgi:RNA methyltransferase, TrmH family